jgi:hypothetical protein
MPSIRRSAEKERNGPWMIVDEQRSRNRAIRVDDSIRIRARLVAVRAGGRVG